MVLCTNAFNFNYLCCKNYMQSIMHFMYIYICFRPVENIRGFSRETVIEVTTNIESQEYRRRENEAIGYPEHPRAGGTDDLETFFGIVHMNLGTTFTLKQFKHYWPKAVRYFSIMFIL